MQTFVVLARRIKRDRTCGAWIVGVRFSPEKALELIQDEKAKDEANKDNRDVEYSVENHEAS